MTDKTDIESDVEDVTDSKEDTQDKLCNTNLCCSYPPPWWEDEEEQKTLIDTILADVNGIMPNFTSLVQAQRLLVGSLEELKRTPDVPFEIFERAVIRADRTGTLIDILLELLCCKITFSSELLAITCAPVDIIQDLSACPDEPNTRRETAATVMLMEGMRQLLDQMKSSKYCFGPPPEIKPTKPPGKPTNPPGSPPSTDCLPGDAGCSDAPMDVIFGVPGEDGLNPALKVQVDNEVQLDLATEVGVPGKAALNIETRDNNEEIMQTDNEVEEDLTTEIGSVKKKYGKKRFSSPLSRRHI